MNKEPISAFYERLARAIENSTKTAAVIAEESGMDTSTLSNIKRGRRNLAVDKLIRICDALGIFPGVLFARNSTGGLSVGDVSNLKMAASAVLEAYFAMRNEIGKDFAGPKQLAEIISIVLEDKAFNVAGDVKNMLRILNRIKPVVEIEENK